MGPRVEGCADATAHAMPEGFPLEFQHARPGIPPERPSMRCRWSAPRDSAMVSPPCPLGHGMCHPFATRLPCW